METERLACRIIEDLRSMGDEATRCSSLRFFKEEIHCHGLKASEVRAYARLVKKEVSKEGKGFLFDICELLWRNGYLEDTLIACYLCESRGKDFEKTDIRLFQRWIDSYVTNWASCDTFCNHTVGMLVEKYPENVEVLKEWASSTNRWLRRGAAVSLIIPARRGKFLNDVQEIAERLLLDPDDMVQKGYGWMLKAASESHQREIFEYMMARKDIMPRTALRYGIEKMPGDLRKMVMDKDRKGQRL